MNKQKFITQTHYNMCDLLEFTLANLGDYRKFSVTYRSVCKQVWVYSDFSNEYRIVIFPIDLLYINAFKGPRSFLHYVKHKMEIIKKLFSQQGNQQP